MRERVAHLVGDLEEQPWISTFHSFCAAILRRFIPAIGFPSGFTIYDADDQTALLRRTIKDLGFDSLRPLAVQARISAAKNSAEGPLNSLGKGDEEYILDVYNAYQVGLKKAGALDFDDLLLRTVELFESREDVIRRYRNRFEHVLVDEYQDINYPQYKLLQLLAPPQNNICAVGDDDQSIYRWRGADAKHIQRFEQDFEGARIVKLEQNYRSTQNILDAAHGVVERLHRRRPKKLWTAGGSGDKVIYFQADGEDSEAGFVVSQVEGLQTRFEASDIAVLFRTNAQSRPFEEAFARHRIPYQLVGGTRFYERKEIKDVIAYMRLGLNPDDIVSLRRIINTPARGIGEATLSKLELLAGQHGIGVWQALEDHLKYLHVGAKIKSALTLFKEMIAAIGEHISHDEPPSQVIDFVLKESGYLGALVKENTDEAMARIDNLKELIAAAKTFETANPDAGVEGFLDQASLISDIDNFDPGSPRITLMTLHCAKGLEFSVVFLVGLEEGLLPHSRSADDPEEMEEERRICYVGMTRAREKLFLTSARSRRTYSGLAASRPSRFLEDIPPGVLDERGHEKRVKRRKTTVGANVDNIRNFFRDKKIDVDFSKLTKHATVPGAEFGVGDKVEFAKYGIGKVIAVEGEGDELRYVVNFRGVGRKKLLARMAKLKKV